MSHSRTEALAAIMFHPAVSKVARLALYSLLLALLAPGIALAANPPQVVVEVAERTEIIEEVHLDGTVTSLHEARLSVQIGGLVEDVFVETGDQVVAGMPLLQLDAELERLALDELAAQHRQAQVSRRDAARRLREARSVGVGRNIPQTEVEARASALAEAEAREAQIEAAMARGKARVSRLRVDAPFDGAIVSRQAERGEWVSPGDPVMVLVDLDVIRLDFPVPQRFHELLDGEATLTYRLDGGNSSWREASITTAVPTTDPVDRTFLLRGEPRNNPGLLPGMAVEGLLQLPTGRAGLTVARDAIQRYPDGRTTVWTVTGEADATATERAVTLADGFGDRVIVTRGIEAGAAVVVKGNEALSEGMAVRVTGGEAR